MKRIYFLLAIMATILTGCIEEPDYTIHIGGGGKVGGVYADFDYIGSTNCCASFIDKSVGDYVLYNFGDDNSTWSYMEPSANFTHQYAKSGLYVVTARASGGKKYDEKKITILVE